MLKSLRGTRHRKQPGWLCAAVTELPEIQSEPGGPSHWPRTAQVWLSAIFRVKSYVVLDLTTHRKVAKVVGNFTRAAPYRLRPRESCSPHTARTEGHSGCSVHRHWAFPSASLQYLTGISFRNHPGRSISLSGQQLQLYCYSERDKGSLKAPGYKYLRNANPEGSSGEHGSPVPRGRRDSPARNLPTARRTGPGPCRGRAGAAAAPLPEPPHVAVLVGEEAVGVIAAVLDVLEAAAVHGAGVAARPRAAEPAHQHLVGVEVAAALGAHGAAAARRAARRLGSGGTRAGAGGGERAELGRTGGAALAAGEAGGGREPPRSPPHRRGRRKAGRGGSRPRPVRRGRERGASRPLGREGEGCAGLRGCSPQRRQSSVSPWSLVFPQCSVPRRGETSGVCPHP